MKVYTTFILSASITRGVTYAKLTHTVAEGRYTTAPYLFPASSSSCHIFLSSKMENRGCARAQGSFRFTRVLASCQKAMCDSLNLAPPSVRL